MALGAGQLVLQADTQSDFAECELVSGTLRWARFQVHQVLRAAVSVPVSQVCAHKIIYTVLLCCSSCMSDGGCSLSNGVQLLVHLGLARFGAPFNACC